ncbi:DNA transposase [Frankliniella fusca]|uniref:DNA transposase n=1 Tax=Frankliniella fusca TaxID=407009 RepID=A0AAE1L5U3_9NEOP|nr:DNA transposase [Frankliniella fusca]
MTGRNARSQIERQVSNEPEERKANLPNPPTHIEKLSEASQWTNWKKMVILFLRSALLHGYIEAPTPATLLQNPGNVETREDAHVMGCIGAVISGGIMRGIYATSKCAYDVWTALCQTFENEGVHRRLSLLYKLMRTKRSSFSTLAEYVVEMQDTHEQLRAACDDNWDEVAAALNLENLRREEDELVRRLTEQASTIIDGATNRKGPTEAKDTAEAAVDIVEAAVDTGEAVEAVTRVVTTVTTNRTRVTKSSLIAGGVPKPTTMRTTATSSTARVLPGLLLRFTAQAPDQLIFLPAKIFKSQFSSSHSRTHFVVILLPQTPSQFFKFSPYTDLRLQQLYNKLEWVGGQCVGYADHGDNMHSLGDDADLAKEALVFMVVSVNDGWKLPVGYFLIASLEAKQRANIMKECLLYLDKTGATVASVTFDGNSSNISCVESLGACLNPMKVKWQPWFIHPSPQRKGQKVYVILDPAHMLKLWRNTFGNESIQLLDAKDTKIKFDYLKKLHELQQTEGLLAGNRLRQRHVFYEREKMKVRLAAQLLSRSTADALEYLRDGLKMPDFKDCAGTVEFIGLADVIFDILNSRNCQATEKQKQPLSANNINLVRSVNNKAIQYIKALNINYNTKDGITQKQKLLYSKWKTGFIGFLGGLDVALRLYTDYVQTGVLKFIPLYNFSQDHLETFFSGIRGRGGWDPNPSALKFMSAYKKLLVHTTLRSNRDGSDCWPLEFISILNVSSSARLSTLCRNDTSDPGNVSDQDVDDLILVGWDQEKPLQELISLSAFTNDVVEYIAGYVGKGLLSKLNCPQCALALTGEDSKSLLLKRKNRGGLFIPSSDLIHVCRMTEFGCFARLRNTKYFLRKPRLAKIFLRTLRRKCFAIQSSQMLRSLRTIFFVKVLRERQPLV